MLVFITSLRHPDSAVDYRQVEVLLERTLASVCRQDGGAYRVVVVGQQRPRFPLPETVDFVPVDFPAPPAAFDGRVDRATVVADKGAKLAVALSAARRYDPTHVMTLDADDLVSRRLAAHCAAHPGSPGWYVNNGYQWVDGSAVLRRVPHRFHRICGTSHIVRTDLLPGPALAVDPSLPEVVDAFGEFTVRALLGSHRHLGSCLSRSGAVLEPLPFPGAVYVLGTGENHSGRDQAILAAPIGARHVREFGLPAASSRVRATGTALQSFAPGTLARYALAGARLESAGRRASRAPG